MTGRETIAQILVSGPPSMDILGPWTTPIKHFSPAGKKGAYIILELEY